MKKVLSFPKKPETSFGTVKGKRMLISCNACGNTKKFYGRALVNPFIVVEQKQSTEYEVTEIGYRNHGNVDEIIEACASCGSTDISVDQLTKGAK